MNKRKVLFGVVICIVGFFQVAAVVAAEERENEYWFIQPYRPNYLLPVSYFNDPNVRPFSVLENPDALGGGKNAVEVKFQISFRDTVWEDTPVLGSDLIFAYTQVSYWQLYNVEESNPFRDTNYEPEGFFRFYPGWKLGDYETDFLDVGFNHQSNGRGEGDFSREWNRVYADWRFTNDRLTISFKPWLRVTDDVQNPGIDDYYGFGELRFFYGIGQSRITSMFRNNVEFSDTNRGAIELGFSRPLGKRLRFFVQYFHGYGESLIDYDYLNQRIGFGIMLSEWN